MLFVDEKSSRLQGYCTLSNILNQRLQWLFFSPLADNLWSTYSEKGSIVERKNQPSISGSEDIKIGGRPYVFTDIMTYFTVLVGIYFPSVTGRLKLFFLNENVCL